MGVGTGRRLFAGVSLNMILHLAVVGVQAATDIDNVDFIRNCIEKHNYYRSRVNPPASNMLDMSWDVTLAKVALEWSKKCVYEHNTDLKVPGKLHPVFATIGENIYVTTGSTLNVTHAITRWYDEVKDYDYDSQRCAYVCGHYTQLVWASSYKVGCAVHTCPSGIVGFRPNDPSTIFVCDYGPAGNYPTRPYLKANKTLVMSGDSSCDHFCIAVLVIRPLSLVVIAAGVYAIQQKYPNIFAYL